MKNILAIGRATYLQLLVFHFAMAFVIYLVESSSQFFLYAIIIYFLYRIISNGNKKDEVLLAAAYITGFEVFSRMTGGSILSYEFAKYSVIAFMLLGMFYRGFTIRSWPYLLFLILLAPGLLFSAMNLNYTTNFFRVVSFNLSGPFCLAIVALYCYNRKMPAQRFQGILLAALLPIVTMAFYLYIYTPNIRDVLSGTQSNFEASGGFGPNQVATILGLGMFILFTRLVTIKSLIVNIVDLLLLAFVSYRGIVTFSRGGILTAALCALVFLAFYLFKSNATEKARLIPKISVIFFVIFITWLITSLFTLGLIDKRYSNRDAAGRLKEDISTGRTDLIEAEMDAFVKHPFTGIGVGKVEEYRFARTGTLAATHNEVSRLLSEHGVFGLIALLLLLLTPLLLWLQNRSNVFLISFFVFWLATINHSSMRIAAPAFIYGLCLISLVNERKTPSLHRK